MGEGGYRRLFLRHPLSANCLRESSVVPPLNYRRRSGPCFLLAGSILPHRPLFRPSLFLRTSCARPYPLSFRLSRPSPTSDFINSAPCGVDSTFKYQSVFVVLRDAPLMSPPRLAARSYASAVGFIRPTFQHAATVYSSNFCHRSHRLATPMAARPIFRPTLSSGPRATFRRSIMPASRDSVLRSPSTPEILFIVIYLHIALA